MSWFQQKYGKECCAHIAIGKGLHQCGFVVTDEPISNLASISTLAIEDLSGRGLL